MHPPPSSSDATAPPAGDSLRIYEQIFRTAADALIIVDRSGHIQLANKQAELLFGLPPERLAGLALEALMPERFRQAHRRHRSLYATRAETRPMGMNLALWARRSDGYEFPVEISLSPLVLDDQTLVCANIRDVSELRRAQALLSHARQSEAVADFGRYALAGHELSHIQHEACQRLIEQLRTDCALVAQLNRAGTALTIGASVGWSADELDSVLPRLSGHWRELSARPREPSRVIDDLRSVDAVDPASALAREFDSLLLCAIPGEAEPAGLLVVGSRRERSFTHDDTNFLQALANTIGAALQRERAEERLFQAQRLEALGQLTGGVAHDFNNLLTVVSGNLQMLEERLADDASASKLIKAAIRATGRGADLTRKLLAFSRRQTLQPRPVDVRQLLVSLAEILRRTLGAHIDVQTEVEDSLPPAHADPGMLDTALLNLAVNSRDAMPDGGELVLGASCCVLTDAAQARDLDLQPGRYLKISVRDTGQGMNADVLARAFEPFFTTKESGKGSGLGLSLVYGFVKQSGGNTQVSSKPGHGTSIDLYLPTSSAMPTADPSSARFDYRGGNETILVVEDDEPVREVALAFLKRLGYRVLEAADANGALQILQQTPQVDLLFTDVILRGGVNGPALAREALRRYPGLRIVFTSGYAPHLLPSRDEFGSDAELLAKPYRVDQLAAMLRRAFDRPAPAARADP
ncbi:MAG: PAS domain S-box protein [Burkholderiales bacterium]|nr:PAS domain S-box protein [Burkholderiales bacterium]